MMSEKIDELVAALVKVQAELEPVKKTETATVVSRRTGGKFTYEYADLGSVLETVLPVLTKHGLALTQVMLPGGWLCTVLAHSSGQYIRSETEVVWQRDGDPQHFGAGVTYMRRYQAMAICGLAAEDDDAASARPTAGDRAKAQMRRSENGPDKLRPAPPKPDPGTEGDLHELMRKHKLTGQAGLNYASLVCGRIVDKSSPPRGEEAATMILLLQHGASTPSQVNTAMSECGLSHPLDIESREELRRFYQSLPI